MIVKTKTFVTKKGFDQIKDDIRVNVNTRGIDFDPNESEKFRGIVEYDSFDIERVCGIRHLASLRMKGVVSSKRDTTEICIEYYLSFFDSPKMLLFKAMLVLVLLASVTAWLEFSFYIQFIIYAFLIFSVVLLSECIYDYNKSNEDLEEIFNN